MPRLSKFTTALLLVALCIGLRSLACPYCTVESSTLSEDMAASDAVVLAKLTPVEGERIIDPDSGKAKFTIEKVLVGKDKLKDVKEIEVVFFGEPIEGQNYFIRGIGVDELDWNIPIPLSDTAVNYVQELQSLPEKGPDRARYFYDYLQHEDPLLAQDSYDEFARTSYPDILDIADKIDHEQLWTWIEDPSVSPNRRSLFFVMLGVVGSDDDVARLKRMMMADGRVLRASAEASAALSMGLGGAITLPILPEMVAMEQRQKQLGFNAMVGCYLKLTGSEGLDVLDAEFLRDDEEDPTKVYGVLLALRFLAEETEDVPMDRLKQSMRLVLEKPDFAEQAIRDLARWEDWTVLDRLVTMFDKADPKTYVKEPIVAYLDQASQQEGEIGEQATAAVAKIEAADPETVKRARSLMSFGFLGFARPGSRDPGEAPAINDPNDPGDTEAPAIEDEADTAETPGSTDEESADDSGESATEEVEPSTESTEKPEAEQPATTSTTQAPAMAMDPPLVPPSQSLVLGVPLIAACVFVGVVWLVLRGGP
jgi:hypothetical protein